jgi:hypothetical protein
MKNEELAEVDERGVNDEGCRTYIKTTGETEFSHEYPKLIALATGLRAYY